MLLDFAPIFTPTGNILQVEYAEKGVQNGTTCIGIKYKDGILILAEKAIESRLIIPNERIKPLSTNSIMAYSGILSNGFCIYKELKNQLLKQTINLDAPTSSGFLKNALNNYISVFTRYLGCRPVGCNFLTAIYDNDLKLYLTKTNGHVSEFVATAIGKGSQRAKTELEKLDFDFDLETAVDNAVRILYLSYDPLKDKDFVIEGKYIDIEGKGEMKVVSQDVINQYVEIYKNLSVDE